MNTSKSLRPAALVLLLLAASCTTNDRTDVASAAGPDLHLVPPQKHGSDPAKLLTYWTDALQDAELARVAVARAFPAWKTYEDDEVSFCHPDDPRLVLEVKKPGDRIPIRGGPVGTTENSFFRSYRLALGTNTYALLLLDRADHFDDGICLCGAVVYRKYAFHNGALFAFDVLEDGQVKKAQVLGNGLRMVLFEWTHLPMTQEVYVQLALSMRLKAGPCDEAAMRKAVLDKHGFEGRLGFLERGMTREDLLALLGAPTRSDRSSLFYVQKSARWQTTTTIALKNGRFEGFRDGWRTSAELPPEPGSIDWISETAEGSGRLSRKTVADLFDRFCVQAPTAPSDDWDRLCRAAYALFKKGHRDARIPVIVRARFEEKETRQHYAAWLLHEYDPDGSRDLFAQRIRVALDEARACAAAGPESARFTSGTWDDLYNLLCFLGEASGRRVPLVLEAMDHPHPDIRGAAYLFWDKIPASDAHPRLLRGLEDADPHVRRRTAMAFEDGAGSAADLPALKKQRDVETEEDTKAHLALAIARLERMPDRR